MTSLNVIKPIHHHLLSRCEIDIFSYDTLFSHMSECDFRDHPFAVIVIDAVVVNFLLLRLLLKGLGEFFLFNL